MPILMDQILREVVDRAYEAARLRRNGVHKARELVSAETLVELEASGDAMRYINYQVKLRGRRHLAFVST
jgi:hypothetical protein